MADEPILETSAKRLRREACLKSAAGGREVLVVDTPAGPKAYGGVCPHLGGPLLEGDVRAGRIRCPWHHYEFDAQDGVCVERPSVLAPERRAASPAPRLALKPYAVRIEGDVLRVLPEEP